MPNIISLRPAKCAVDLGDGSERGEYVSQDYILSRLGRPHRAINLMYCYYPLDKGWPGRASVVHAHADASFAWDYPYDDYFPFHGEEVFEQMRDIRRHGQDVILTLTVDPNVTDEHIVSVVERLKSFGRMQLRINHEATGTWFQFNRRCGYQQVADFYVRFHKIVKEIAPHILTILCIGGIEKRGETRVVKEDEFAEAVKITDVWSVDKYLSLNFKYPYEIAEPDNFGHYIDSLDGVYALTKASFKRFKHLNGGVTKPMVMSELNCDGDVSGPYWQAARVKEFTDLIKNDPEQGWFSGFTFYQFRDRGRLGLEIQDPNNAEVGWAQPIFDVYREIISDPYFSPLIDEGAETAFPAKLRWGGSEDADGVSLPLEFEGNPVFCEVYFDDGDIDLNLMLELNGRWFYKSPGVKAVDLIYAFFDKPLTEPTPLRLNIFAPPASGENRVHAINHFETMQAEPTVRIRYRPSEEKNFRN
ncbi:hypothetical protein FACS1894208_11950 [Clostridia bacterium]|nr:hypothetical protein FACS1894208_11950 [Clostridia bacterium]